MNTVKVRDIEIGAGAPKIIVPIVGVTKNDIIEEAKTFHSIPVDVVEWRVDWFEGVFDFAQVEDVLKNLRPVLGETPILFTFRTSKEGGEKAIEADAYAELNKKAAATGLVDLVDVEAFTQGVLRYRLCPVSYRSHGWMQRLLRRVHARLR